MKRRRQLKALRALLELDQVTVARRSKIHYSRYVRIENGYTMPRAEECRAIASVLRTTVAAAFPDETPQPVTS